MTKLIYITHPAVEIKPEIPVEKWPVSEAGWKQVNHLVKLLNWKEIDSIYSSEENKTLRTSEFIQSRYLHLVSPFRSGNLDLGEIDRSSTGFLEQTSYLKAMKEFYQYPDKSYQGWETANEATVRTISIVSNIMNDNEHKTVAIVGHGAVGTLLVCALKKIAPTILEDPKKMGCYLEIDWDKKQVLSNWWQY